MKLNIFDPLLCKWTLNSLPLFQLTNGCWQANPIEISMEIAKVNPANRWSRKDGERHWLMADSLENPRPNIDIFTLCLALAGTLFVTIIHCALSWLIRKELGKWQLFFRLFSGIMLIELLPCWRLKSADGNNQFWWTSTHSIFIRHSVTSISLESYTQTQE